MIDQNTIVEIINNTIPAIAASPVLIKLFSSVENVIKTLYMPTLTLKNGKAEVDVEVYRKQNNEVLESQSFTLYEITKLKNFINTANFAAQELQQNEDQSANNNKIDFDWIMRFFDAVSNISNENLQRLWGKVLAGEIQQQGLCSLRTMDIIRNLSQKESTIYNKLCKYVLKSDDCYFILNNGFLGINQYNQNSHNYILRTGLNYSDDIILMIECGLLSIDNELATDFATNPVLNIQNSKISCFIIADESEEHFFSIEPYFLTRSGIELFKVIQNMTDFQSDTEYSILCFRELKNEYTDLSVSVHNILGTDDFDPHDLL